MASPTTSVPAVDERLEQMRDALKDNAEARDYFPGLDKLLTKYLENSSYDPNQDTVDKELFIRGMLRCFYKTEKDDTYSKILATYSDEEQRKIRAFVEQKQAADDLGPDFTPGVSPPVREELDSLQHAPAHESHIQTVEDSPILHEAVTNGAESVQRIWQRIKTMLSFWDHDAKEQEITPHQDMEFNNWGYTVQNKPRFTYVPTTVKGVQAIVKVAVKNNMSVRVSGFRHSWSPIFGRNGQILISMIGLWTATQLPNVTSLPFPESKPTELESIHLLGDSPSGDGKKLVRVGSAVTNERFRRWCKSEGRVTLPLNVIMVEITMGGSNAPICHGAGRQHKTLSDLVKVIEYVDAHGDLHVIEDPRLLRAASGCFGLMGVVTHLTLEVESMSYAVMWPSKLPTLLAIPPPHGVDVFIPEAFRTAAKEYLKATGNTKPMEQVMQEAQADFEKRANEDYYAEWFWFPYSDYVWINTWQNTPDSSNIEDYPSGGRIFLQWTETVLMNIFQNIPFQDKVVGWFGVEQPLTTLISKTAMLALPERVQGKAGSAGKPIKTTVADALHFQRAIQNVRVRDMEVEMPLVARADDASQVDYTIVQRAWWDAIAVAYQNTKTCPMRMPLEMRIMSDSNVIMAPQRGNTMGTCSIEVLTLETCKHIWLPFAQQVLDKWMSYEHNGKRLNTRPHWAKEWAIVQKGKDGSKTTLKVDGVPWFDKLKKDCAAEIKEFNAVLEEIGKMDGWTRRDIKARFSNDMLDKLFFDDL